MLANITRKLNAKRRIILQRFLNDKNTLSTIPNTDVPLRGRYASYICKPTGKQNHSVFSVSKNIVRYSTNLAIQGQELFMRKRLSSTILKTQIPDEEVEKLLKLDWTSLSSAEFVSNFEKLSVYIHNLDEKPEINYESLLQAFTALKPNFVEEEIVHVLEFLCTWSNNENYPKDVLNYFFQNLDNECFKRISKISIENLFTLSHFFICLRCAKNSNFTRKAILKLSSKVKRMSPAQIAQFMGLMSVCKNKSVNLYEVEYQIEKTMKNFSIHDLSRISNGFYKNGSHIKSGNLLKYILETMLNNMDAMSSNNISAFSKILRLSYRPIHEVNSLLREVLQSLEPQVPKLTLITTTYVSELAAHVLIYEKGLMTSIFERFDQEIENAGMKDIERIIFSLTTFNYDSSYPLYSKIVDEITSPHRRQDIENHRKSFAIILKYLNFVNIYPIKILEEVMDSEYINKTFKSKYSMAADYLYLDQNIAAEVPNYTGPRLSDDLRIFLSKRFNKSELSLHSRTMQEVIATCRRILKTESEVFIDKVLPQYRNHDIIICLDEQNNLIPPETILSCMNPDSVKYVPEEAKKYKWFNIIIGTRNMLLTDSHEFTGILTAKCRQLKSLGYIPIVVSEYKWFDINSSEDCEKLQENYMKSLLNNALPPQSLLPS